MTRRRTLGLAGAAALGALAFWFWRGRAAPAKDQAARTVMAVEGPVEETVEATGEVEPANRVEIKPPISGRVENLLVEEGDAAREGQILAWMSSADRAAVLDAARAKGPEELKRWEDAYKPTPIVAPLSGSIILRDVVVGQTVGTGDVLFAMADKLIVRANVDETDIGRVRVGMPARIALDAFLDRPIPGKVASILYEGKNVSNVITYGVKVEPRSVPPFFRSRMTANVSLVVKAKEKAVLIPLAAVREERSGEKRVLVPGPDGEPLARQVRTGAESGENVEILDGLKAGDPVLIARKRYAAQKGSSSPLVMGGRPRGEASGESREGRRRGNRGP